MYVSVADPGLCLRCGVGGYLGWGVVTLTRGERGKQYLASQCQFAFIILNYIESMLSSV